MSGADLNELQDILLGSDWLKAEGVGRGDGALLKLNLPSMSEIWAKSGLLSGVYAQHLTRTSLT